VDEDVVLRVDVDADGLSHRVAGNEQLQDFFLVIQLRRVGVERVLRGLLFSGRYLRVSRRRAAADEERNEQGDPRAFHGRNLLRPRILARRSDSAAAAPRAEGRAGGMGADISGEGTGILIRGASHWCVPSIGSVAVTRMRIAAALTAALVMASAASAQFQRRGGARFG